MGPPKSTDCKTLIQLRLAVDNGIPKDLRLSNRRTFSCPLQSKRLAFTMGRDRLHSNPYEL